MDLRSTVHKKLCHKLESAKTVEGMTTKMVRTTAHLSRHTPTLTAFYPHPQAQDIMDNHSFLSEAHILTLANEKKKHILVFQDKEKDMYNCCVDVVHYKPGWMHPRKVTRKEAHVALAAGAIALHLDYPPSHFSALLRVATPNARKRKSPRDHMDSGTDLANGAILLSP